MATKRQAGYEYRGWKLGEKVKWIKDGKEHTIIAFFEGGKHNESYYIALDCADGYHDLSKCLSTTILAGASYSRYMWVKEKEIEKIEKAKNQQQTKVLYGEAAAEYLRKNYHNIFCRYEDIAEKKIIFLDAKVKCILDEEIAIRLAEEIRKMINNETLEKIKNYDYERDAEKKEQAKEFVVTEEMAEQFKKITTENFEKEIWIPGVSDNSYTENHIKPSHYKINVAGNECEVKDVIKAFVKDYDSFLVGNIIKYVARYRKKNGLEDVKKSKEYIEELIKEMEGKNE